MAPTHLLRGGRALATQSLSTYSIRPLLALQCSRSFTSTPRVQTPENPSSTPRQPTTPQTPAKGSLLDSFSLDKMPPWAAARLAASSATNTAKPPTKPFPDPFRYDATRDSVKDILSTDAMLNSRSLSQQRKARQVPIRTVPQAGRTIHVFGNVTPERAIEKVNVKCGQHRMSGMFNAQKSHERPGKRRKRLRSQRWQTRFKNGFRATAARVRELAKQGW